MADRLICPVCGESNPADMEFCRNCQSRLQPLSGPLKDESDAIQPGELPTKKVTSELEPLLPQWLRDARQQARDTAAEDLNAAGQEQKEPPASSAPDLLDGLASQSEDDDEDIPDWLAQITGATSKKKKPASEDRQVKRVELGRGRQALPLDQATDVPPEPPAQTPRASEKDELSDWFRQAGASSQSTDFHMPPAPLAEQSVSAAPQQPTAEPQPASEDLSWLTRLDAASETQPTAPAESAPREEAPDWLKKLQAEQTPPPAPVPPVNPALQADVPDWLKQFEEPAAAALPAEPAASLPDEQPVDFGAPDWLQGLPGAEAPTPAPQEASSAPLIPAELPDWLSSLGVAQETPRQAEPQPPASEPAAPAELPDWISSLGTQHEAVETTEPQGPAAPAELPDWMSALGGGEAASLAATEAEPPATGAMPAAELPDRTSPLGAEDAGPQAIVPEPAPTGSEAVAPADLPDWISSLDGEQPATSQPAEAQPTGGEPFASFELPDWLSSLGTEQAAAPATESQAAPAGAMPPAEMPDWLSSLGGPQPSAEEATPAAPQPEKPVEVPAQEAPAAGPAFTPDALAGEDVDAVFASMKTPAWLSAVLPSSEETPESGSTPPAAAEEPIAPAELPSWVQAMRPVESVGAPSAGAGETNVTEERGPLAGLHGVLPTIPGAGEPSSKPKAQSFRLSASEQQLAHAALLERILAAETSPIPMRTGGVLRPQKMLRWFIGAVLLLVIGGIVLGGTRFFALPGGVPNETVAAIGAVEAIPPDAPVLVVFDYQPSTVGEMEAAAGPLLDHMLLLTHPRLALLSTSPTGAALAERFMSTVVASRGYVRDQQYINLGYLPGGLAGVYSFARNPAASVPLDAQMRAAWQSSFLAPVQSFSDFAAVIVLTDSAETGRTWIEQTALSRGNRTMVLAASAQAAPMLLPYVDSGQVSGMVSGIYGAVGVEQRNAGSPGLVRRYWDGYSAGLYLAVAMIALGALWNLWLGIRDRRAQAVE